MCVYDKNVISGTLLNLLLVSAIGQQRDVYIVWDNVGLMIAWCTVLLEITWLHEMEIETNFHMYFNKFLCETAIKLQKR